MSHRGFYVAQPLIEYLKNIIRKQASQGARSGFFDSSGGSRGRSEYVDRGQPRGPGRSRDRGRSGGRDYSRGRGRDGASVGRDQPVEVIASVDYSELRDGLKPSTRRVLEEYVEQNNGLKVRYKDPCSDTGRSYKITGIGPAATQAS